MSPPSIFVVSEAWAHPATLEAATVPTLVTLFAVWVDVTSAPDSIPESFAPSVALMPERLVGLLEPLGVQYAPAVAPVAIPESFTPSVALMPLRLLGLSDRFA